jgi:hypothetical protein
MAYTLWHWVSFILSQLDKWQACNPKTDKFGLWQMFCPYREYCWRKTLTTQWFPLRKLLRWPALCPLLLLPYSTLNESMHTLLISFLGAGAERLFVLKFLIVGFWLTGAAVKPFGSFLSNLYAKSGDLDVSVELSNGSDFHIKNKKKNRALKQIRNALQVKGNFFLGQRNCDQPIH